MVDYEMYHRIHFCFRNLSMNKQQIATSLGISRPTVRRWLKKDSFCKKSYSGRESKLDPYKIRIDELLKTCPTYTARQVFNLIKSEGFDGGRTIVAGYVAKVRPRLKKAFLTIYFPPGKTAQVDWGVAGYIQIGGRKRKVSYFVMVLCYSRMMFVKFTLSEAQEAWNECHREAFEYFGGVPRQVMVDNCKTAVIRNAPGEKVRFNESYVDLANHYGFEIIACNVRQPQEKGRVENGVGYVRKSFVNGRKLEPFELLNIEVRDWMDQIANARQHATTNRKPVDMLLEDTLNRLPIHPYDCSRREAVKINKMYRVRYDGNSYSVPAEYVYEDAILEVSTTKIRVWAKERVIAEHPRCYSRGEDIRNELHDQMLIQHRKRAEEQKMTAWLMRLTPRFNEFYQLMCSRTLTPILELRKLFALGQVFDKAEIAQAMEDSIKFEACNAAYVRNILEQKQLDLVGALHISHKSDALKMSLNSPNISIYEGK